MKLFHPKRRLGELIFKRDLTSKTGKVDTPTSRTKTGTLAYFQLSEPPRALEIRLPCFLTLLSIFLETLGEGVVGMTYILTNKEINEIVVIISRCQSPIANRQLAKF